MTKVLYEFIPEKLLVFIDYGGIMGPEKKDENEISPGIRNFVNENINNVSKILKRLNETGLTISLEKPSFGNEHIDIVEYRYNSEGRIPIDRNISKIMEWNRPKNLKEVRGFVALSGYYRNLLKIFLPFWNYCLGLGEKR
ncbi:Transposon Tf2-9 polyprotein [Smittium culicis]|uniref:Transposon Tf2-9 polyprotein n=1 Tax=Smittium culicis TaxID=133412 RepID=A0A1R1YBJ1_9FUNG|nr:Transposon Tf2-9 polyprotein [Smittium culicis]